MNNNKRYLPVYALIMILGAAALIFGLISSKLLDNSLISGFSTGLGIVVLSSALTRIATALATSEQKQKELEIELKDERNSAIREKAAWSTCKVLLPTMGVAALALALSNQFIGACVIAGIILVYSVSLAAFSTYYSKRL